jgi:hypothetical protein
MFPVSKPPKRELLLRDLHGMKRLRRVAGLLSAMHDVDWPDRR